MIDQHDFKTRAVAKQATFEYIEIGYNRHRRHSALGYLSLFEYNRVQSQHVA